MPLWLCSCIPRIHQRHEHELQSWPPGDGRHPGKTDPDEAAPARAGHPARSVLFRRNLGTEAEVRALVLQLIEVMGPEALIGLDQEGGGVVRATFLPLAPAAMALGACGDEALAEATGAAVARGLRSIGINWNFAPVLDVNNNPANLVIAERSFQRRPGRSRASRGRLDARLAERGRGLAASSTSPGMATRMWTRTTRCPPSTRAVPSWSSWSCGPSGAGGRGALGDDGPHRHPQIDPELPATLARAARRHPAPRLGLPRRA